MKSKIGVFTTLFASMCLTAGIALAQSGPCAFPSKTAASIEETAWQLFIATACPTGESKAALTWP